MTIKEAKEQVYSIKKDPVINKIKDWNILYEYLLDLLDIEFEYYVSLDSKNLFKKWSWYLKKEKKPFLENKIPFEFPYVVKDYDDIDKESKNSFEWLLGVLNSDKKISKLLGVKTTKKKKESTLLL